jgi:hypothetical protein
MTRFIYDQFAKDYLEEFLSPNSRNTLIEVAGAIAGTTASAR